MLYLNTSDIEKVGKNWKETIDVIEHAVHSLYKEDYAQPVKPYLRYHDMANRIIAMPAFVGGDTYMAGIKWIASFPKNLQEGIQRAHSITILNEARTGKPVATINTALVSGIRTASVSGLLLKHYEQVRPLQNVTVGIIGFGPIGRLHLQMVTAMLGEKIDKVVLYDIAGIQQEHIPAEIKEKTVIAQTWEEAYCEADVFIACTVSPHGFIDKQPKRHSLLLNVSLRDFTPKILDYTRSIIVDDWTEVCRENTDIEIMHLERGLQKEDTKSITDIVCLDQMKEFPQDEPIMFNPMGMAIFDIAIAAYYYKQALSQGIGTHLQD
ncbi:2,3-diaminopropionate biosynthesis protein SbnB [Brevibacillus sp. RS1.1]|uniref:2,3-diaminopropionate biosynthesis protein SbnB n=1 Tax=Brevibacillus sp. RS1.1 TaxID=2738982 RepID=UPI00156AAB32|nr:2,3-diaminopropionate biosynthesis protein SbnB [Brevibacillus sp. RS1.1]NRR00834.1 2,3-diaminopropionate biosynthesis protein SbnB [Brevibacillus sp. RS1.1]